MKMLNQIKSDFNTIVELAKCIVRDWINPGPKYSELVEFSLLNRALVERQDAYIKEIESAISLIGEDRFRGWKHQDKYNHLMKERAGWLASGSATGDGVNVSASNGSGYTREWMKDYKKAVQQAVIDRKKRVKDVKENSRL